MPSRRQIMRAALAGGAIAATPHLPAGLPAGFSARPARAQARTLRMIVPFPAGGATDVVARVLAEPLGAVLGRSVVIDNRPGAGGSIGSLAVARAAPDGDTLLMATTSTHSIGPVFNASAFAYDPVRDFTAISYVVRTPNVLVVPGQMPWRTVADLIAAAKAAPGRLNFGSSGNGTILHLSAELFVSMAGIDMVHVPYRGTALAVPDMVAGRVQMLFDAMPAVGPHLASGALRALGVSTLETSPAAPGVPTIAATLPGYESDAWFGVFAPPGLPAARAEELAAAIRRALAGERVRARMVELGAEVIGGGPEALVRVAVEQREKWGRLIRERNIRPD